MRPSHLLLAPSLLLLGSISLRAGGDFTALRDDIVVARKTLITMVLYRDKRGPEQQRRVRDSAEAVSARFARLMAPPGKSAAFTELEETWLAFKATREAELVPAILAGEREKAEFLASGIQKARLDRMYALIDAMDK